VISVTDEEFLKIAAAVLDEHTVSSTECEICGVHLTCTCDYRTEYSTSHLVEKMREAMGRD
jgi:hypothetical protein